MWFRICFRVLRVFRVQRSWNMVVERPQLYFHRHFKKEQKEPMPPLCVARGIHVISATRKAFACFWTVFVLSALNTFGSTLVANPTAL